MNKNSGYILAAFLIAGLLCLSTFSTIHAQLPGWSGDEHLSFLVIVNGVSAEDSNTENPIPVNLSDPISLQLTLNVQSDMTINTGKFSMQYLGISIFNQQLVNSTPIPAPFNDTIIDTDLDLSSLTQGLGIDLISGTIRGVFTFNYTLDGETESAVVEADFVLRIGQQGVAAIVSINGLITLGFSLMAIFSLLLALDDFQSGIFAARKVRKAKSADEVGIFPKQIVLRRKKKEEAQQVSKEELINRVSDVAGKTWDEKRCPKCGKKWKKGVQNCSKCDISKPAALQFFSKDIADYAPKALDAVPYGSKVTVSKFAKRVKLRPNKAGALAAALTDMGVFQTKSVKVPLEKVTFAGLTLSGMYWSWMQLIYGALPDLVTVFLTTTAGLVVSVIVGYFMKWLARVPKLGYD